VPQSRTAGSAWRRLWAAPCWPGRRPWPRCSVRPPRPFKRTTRRCAEAEPPTAQAAGSVGFAAELFAEAAAYYVARDLPSVVGKDRRVATPAEAIRLKDAIRSVARSTAQAAAREAVGREGAAPVEPREWRAYVGGVLRALQGGGAAPAPSPRSPRSPRGQDRR